MTVKVLTGKRRFFVVFGKGARNELGSGTIRFVKASGAAYDLSRLNTKGRNDLMPSSLPSPSSVSQDEGHCPSRPNEIMM